MARPIVGIVPLYDEKKDSYWMLPGYMKMLEDAGTLPLMLPLTEDAAELEQALSLCNGVLFPGGQDVDPACYHAERLPLCGVSCEPRDHMETFLVKQAISRDLPVLGICRGIQLINAALGGTLYQDLASEHPGNIEHHMDPPYDRGVHTVSIRPDTLLSKILGSRELSVNSYHHQAIRQLAAGLRIDAVSQDGLIEAVDMPDQRFFLALQWHPEFWYLSDEASRRIIAAFAAACSG